MTAQTGVTMDRLLQELEDAGLGLTAHPAPGDVTLGGILAIDGHGTAIPAVGESRTTGHTYGSVSNLVLSLRAVVWNGATSQYELQSFARDDPAIQPFLTHLGRTFVTDVTLQVGANSRLRCQSFTDIPISELFGPAGSSPRTYASFLEQAGRVEAIWYPFTDNPWFKVWSVAPTKPAASRYVSQPYNYVFADVIPKSVSNLAEEILSRQRGGDSRFRPGRVRRVGRWTGRHGDQRHLGLGQGRAALRQALHRALHGQRLRRADQPERKCSRPSTSSPRRCLFLLGASRPKRASTR